MTNAEAMPDRNSTSDAVMFERLRDLKRACGSGTGLHDQAIVMINACIDEGLDTRSRLVAAMKQLGFSPAHVAITLNKAAGCNPERHRWSQDEAGRYRLLN